MKTPFLERKMFMKSVGIAAMVVLVVLSSVRQSIAAALPEISVSGNTLVANDQVIVLRGVNALDPLALNRYIGHWDNDYFAQMSGWGAKVVRLPIHPSEWKNHFYDYSGTCTFPLVYQGCRNRITVISQAVSWAADNGMYSIIDWHVIGSLVTGYFPDRMYNTTQAETEDFWRQIATRFKDDTRVAAYELLNEPVTDRNGWQVSESQWIAQRNWFEALVDVIRAIDPNKPIICNGLDWGYNLVFAGANPVRRTGIIYGTHPYPVKALPWDTYFGYLKATYPVLATEFGFQNDGSEVYDESVYQGGGLYRTDLDTYLETKGIGWMAWNYGPTWAPVLTLDWNYTPSEQGVFYRDKMLAAGGNPPPVNGVMHVSNIAMSFLKNKINYSAMATVTIVDDNSQPVGSATVYGTFSGATNNNVNGLTDANGQVTLTSSAKRNGGTWTFTVNNVTKSGWIYNPSLNIETSDNITAP
jgi:endoglucanase